MVNEIRTGFRYSKRFTPQEKGVISRIIGSELNKGNTQTNIIKILRDRGYSYWDKNMAYDIRRKEAVYKSKSVSAEKDAGKWFDNVFEVFRAKHKLTSSQANKVWIKTQINARRQMLEALNEKEFWDLYKGMFT